MVIKQILKVSTDGLMDMGVEIEGKKGKGDTDQKIEMHERWKTLGVSGCVNVSCQNRSIHLFVKQFG